MSFIVNEWLILFFVFGFFLMLLVSICLFGDIGFFDFVEFVFVFYCCVFLVGVGYYFLVLDDFVLVGEYLVGIDEDCIGLLIGFYGIVMCVFIFFVRWYVYENEIFVLF